MSSRLNQYKSKALDNSELRRRREEEGVQIRKAKREEQVCRKLTDSNFKISLSGTAIFPNLKTKHCIPSQSSAPSAHQQPKLNLIKGILP